VAQAATESHQQATMGVSGGTVLSLVPLNAL
jgi:hypothetical protein